MGELESRVREYAPIVLLERAEDTRTLEVLAKEVDEALQDVRDGLDVVVSDRAREDLQPVVEQDIDPVAYTSADYTATVSYGDTTQSVYYKGLKHDGSEANSTSYDVNGSGVEEGKLRREVHDAHTDAKEAQMMGRTAVSDDFDPVRKNAKQEMAMRSSPIFSFVQYALIGKVDFL